MLSITFSADDDTNVELLFEHSLVSLSKWEEKFEVPFFKKEEWTNEMSAEYIRCMLLTENVPANVLDQLSPESVEAITAYINAKRSATWFNETSSGKKSAEVITSELIYYWMVQFKINWDAQYWHLNRLMTLIKICSVKQSKPKKMSKAEQQAEMRKLNAERRAASGSSG